MSSFNKLSVKGLKSLIAHYKKEHMPLVRYSNMKKHELVSLLESKFTLRDGKMYLKKVTSTPTTPVTSKKPVAKKPVTSSMGDEMNAHMHHVRTADQDTLNAAIKRIENNKKASQEVATTAPKKVKKRIVPTPVTSQKPSSKES